MTLGVDQGGPNGWKVRIAPSRVCAAPILRSLKLSAHPQVVFLIEELGLTYETIYLDFASGEQKKEPHTKHNPNGFVSLGFASHTSSLTKQSSSV